jgi:regulator of sigma E protease
MEILMSWIQQGFIAVVPFVVLLGILIFVHELGHFLVARWCGVRVEVFSLGFGKKIFSYKKGDTTYALSIIPLGGYVKMFGEQPGDHISEADKKYSFTHKNVFQRIAVVLAGPLMNFFFAVLVFWALALIGEEMHKPMLGDIDANSPAYAMGFRSGDVIKTFEEFGKALNKLQNREIAVAVNRDGAPAEVNAKVAAKPNPNILTIDDTVGDIDGINIFARGTNIGVEGTSPLYTVGLRTGDHITAINGKKITFWRDIEPTLKGISSTSALTLDIERPVDEKSDKTEKLSITLAGGRVKNYTLSDLKIGSTEMYISKVAPKSPAEAAGLQKGDQVVAIDGKKMAAWEDVVATIKNFSGQQESMNFDIIRAEMPLSLQIKPQMTSQMSPNGTEDKRYTVGVYPMVNFADIEPVIVKAVNPAMGLVRGFTRTVDVSVMMIMSFVRLIENKISPKNIGGVLSIGQAASETFKLGIDKFLQMMAFISVNLFILNLLPIPVLDGGHLVFYVVEAIKGSPMSLKKMEMAQQVGLVLLMSLMVFALFNDITRFLGAH